MSDDDPRATNDPQRAANDRRDELTDHVEHILETVDADLEEDAYPVESEELAAQYRSSEFELANETESFGSAFDRLADEYENFADPDEAREALTAELDRADAYDEAFNDREGTAAGRTVPEGEAAAEGNVIDDDEVGEGLGDEMPSEELGEEMSGEERPGEEESTAGGGGDDSETEMDRLEEHED